MTARSAKRSVPWLDSGPRLLSDVREPMPPQASFHASLRECAENRVERRTPQAHKSPTRSAWASRPRGQNPGFAERAAVWLRAQYKSWATRQLEAARAVSLVKESPIREKTIQPQRHTKGVLTRIWSWVQSRYTLSGTKRLRVAEVASLGEKRFVALVTVEGREFLIGGGAAGVSLLTPLGAAPEPAEAIQGEFAVKGDFE